MLHLRKYFYTNNLNAIYDKPDLFDRIFAIGPA